MLGRPPILYKLTDPPPKSAHYRLTFTETGLCRYFCQKPRLLSAARRALAEGKAVKAEPLTTRRPGRPKGSGTTPRQNRERVYYLLRTKLNASEEFNVDWSHPWRSLKGKRGDPAFVTYRKVGRWLKAKDLIAILESVDTFESLLPALFPEYAKVVAWREGDKKMAAFYAELEKNPHATLETP